jgi:hypothetical protein
MQQTEGRTGRERDARAAASGKSALRFLLHRAFRHRRIAVPPAEFSAR